MKSPSRYVIAFAAIIALELAVPREVASAENGTRSAPAVDHRYTPEALQAAFARLCQRLGYKALSVTIDQSEFPFLVHGVLAGRCDYKAIRDELRSMPDYSYSGCVTSIRDGSKTIFALNMIPQREYERNPRQLMNRMEDLARSHQ